jgi:putative oxidoreductase
MHVASLLLRFALAATYISAYSSRINLFGGHPNGWNDFMKYAATVNSFAPASMQFMLAISATVLEIALSVLLVIGFKIRYTAIASGILTCAFALAMTLSFGVKEPLDYGVFVNFMAAFLLATLPNHKWSLDTYLTK